jgi:hypothetical protein
MSQALSARCSSLRDSQDCDLHSLLHSGQSSVPTCVRPCSQPRLATHVVAHRHCRVGVSPSAGVTPQKAANRLNILLVDDQQAKLLSYQVILAGIGETLLEASSACEAFEHPRVRRTAELPVILSWVGILRRRRRPRVLEPERLDEQFDGRRIGGKTRLSLGLDRLP